MQAADVEASVTRYGVTVHHARYGYASPTLVLLPTWSLVHSRHWKMQVPPALERVVVLRRFDEVVEEPVGWAIEGTPR
jgi:hypothetical protein